MGTSTPASLGKERETEIIIPKCWVLIITAICYSHNIELIILWYIVIMWYQLTNGQMTSLFVLTLDITDTSLCSWYMYSIMCIHVHVVYVHVHVWVLSPSHSFLVIWHTHPKKWVCLCTKDESWGSECILEERVCVCACKTLHSCTHSSIIICCSSSYSSGGVELLLFSEFYQID